MSEGPFCDLCRAPLELWRPLRLDPWRGRPLHARGPVKAPALMCLRDRSRLLGRRGGRDPLVRRGGGSCPGAPRGRGTRPPSVGQASAMVGAGGWALG
jgi:hypothetical protein